MKVLFVSTGNYKDGISPITKIQGESLINNGVQVEFFTITGKGIWSYLCHIFILRKYLKKNKFDIVHTHYSFCAYVATLAGAKPLVVSLMGSDVIGSKTARIIIRVFYRIFWENVIVKSNQMKFYLKIRKSVVIPNGVNLDFIKPIDKNECREKLSWQSNKIHLLFGSNPARVEKNYSLIEKAIALIHSPQEIEIHFLQNISPLDVPFYINASDVVLLSSLQEGSPNVIKEAMACNCPIVSTDVGDVKEIIDRTEGCFISSYDPQDFADKLKLAISFGRTDGRSKMTHLNSNIIANKIISIYNNVLKIS